MPLQARRALRLSLSAALALAAGYALALPLAYIAPIFVLLLGAQPGPPMAPKALLVLIGVVLLSLGLGLVLIPVLLNYPVAGFLLVAVGIYLSNSISVAAGKAVLGTLLIVGLTMIPVAGTVDFALAKGVVTAMVSGVVLAVVCQWLVYPWFPETEAAAAPGAVGATTGAALQPRWIALRATLIVLPPFLLALSNPGLYLPTILKSVMLGQQGSTMDVRTAGRELLGSTVAGGFFAVVFWFALKLNPGLWMFFLWMLLIGLYLSAKLYGVLPGRFPASFWQNAAVTMLILLGPAVQDSATGKDVYQAFAVRMGLFVGVTLYALAAVLLLEQLRARRPRGSIAKPSAQEAP